MSITIVRNGEGFGSLYQCMMSGIAYCRYYDKKFVYTPVKLVGHDVNRRDFDNFTGLLALSDRDKFKPEKHEYMREVHFAENPNKYYTPKVRKELRDLYNSTSKPDKCPFDIAIHIRRGDVVQRKQAGRFIQNKDYNIVIQRLQKEYPNYSIGIYSEGIIDDFKDIDFDKKNFILNGNPLVSFHHLVTAKVLVVAKSSFSFAAAILNEGDIWYIPAKHKPFDDWKVIDDIKSPDKI